MACSSHDSNGNCVFQFGVHRVLLGKIDSTECGGSTLFLVVAKYQQAQAW
jgi:hypothetical protein